MNSSSPPSPLLAPSTPKSPPTTLLSHVQTPPPAMPSSLSLSSPQLSSTFLTNEKAVLLRAARQSISQFLTQQKSPSPLPVSGKIVVFNSEIPIQLAFYALVEHDTPCAPILCAATNAFIGILTVEDFIRLLIWYSQEDEGLEKLSRVRIGEVVGVGVGVGVGGGDSGGGGGDSGENENFEGRVRPGIKHGRFIGVDENTTLLQSCRLLIQHKIDFLPVILPQDLRCIGVLTYTIIIDYLVTHFREQRRLFDDSIGELGIGTYENIILANTGMKLIEVLTLMNKNKLSAVPVVDEEGKVVDVYSCSDITFLATATDADSAVANLQLPLGEVLALQHVDVTTGDKLCKGTVNQSLQYTFEVFSISKFNRLILVDEGDRVVGIVSAKDLVSYFVTHSEEDDDVTAGKVARGNFD